MVIYKWKWMMLGALGCMNNVDFAEKKVNGNIVLDVFIICQKLRHVQVILKIPYSYPKASTARCRQVVLVESHPFCTTLDLQLTFYRPLCYTALYCSINIL